VHLSGTHWIGGWEGLRAGLDAGGKRKHSSLPQPGIECWASSP